MEFVIQEEARKVLEQELRKARQQRQKQVRQQSVQWSEETRRKYENEKEKQVKIMTAALTQEAEQHAKKRIEHLLVTHDLAIAEVGAAHRAAAHLRDAEKAKELKRLQDQQVAQQRGHAALGKTKSELERKSQAQIGMKQRKDEIRKEEDRKSKELINERIRKPLSVTNSNLSAIQLTKSNSVPGGPRYDQSAASKLRIPSKASTKITSSKKLLQPKSKTPSKLSTVPTGRLGKEVQLRAPVSSSKASQLETLKSKTSKISSPKKTKTGKAKLAPVKPKSATVIYYDNSIPKSESQYISPAGLGERETSSQSPDAWAKAEILSRKTLTEIEEKAKKQEEMLRKASSRGEAATKKAKLQKQLTAVTSELMADHDSFTKLGSGQQSAMLGLDDIPEDMADEHLEQEEESEDSSTFLAMSSDEDVVKVSPEETLSNFRVNEDDADGSRVAVYEIPSIKTPKKSKSKLISISVADKMAAQTIQSIDEQLSKLSKLQVQNHRLLQTPQTPKQISAELKKTPEKDDQSQGPASHIAASKSEASEIIYPTKKHKKKTPKMSIPLEPATAATTTDKNDASSAAEYPDAISISKASKISSPKRKNEKTAKASSLSKHVSVTNKNLESTKKIASPKKKIKATSGPEETSNALLPMSSDEEVLKVSSEETMTNSHANEDYGNSSKKDTVISSSQSTVADIRMKTEIHPDSTDNEFTEPQRVKATERPKKKKSHKKVKKDPVKVTIITETPKSDTPGTSAAEGPFTSTPDGQLKLKLKGSSNRLNKVGPQPSKRDLILGERISKLLLKNRESIIKMGVSSSSSSNLVIDDTTGPSRTPSSSGLSSFNTPSSGNKWTSRSTPSSETASKTWLTILEEHTLLEDSLTEGSRTKKVTTSSRSTIGEVLVKTYSPSPNGSSSIQNDETNTTVTSHLDISDTSLMKKLSTLSKQQEIKVLQNELEVLIKEGIGLPSLSSPGGSDPTRETIDTVDGVDTDEETSIDIHDMSMVLQEIRSKQSENSPLNPDAVDADELNKKMHYSDKELQRINEFIGDLSDCGDIWSSPPLNGSKDHADIVSSVFEEFRDDLASIPMFIERPPWSSGS